jgi:hypothetical protein
VREQSLSNSDPEHVRSKPMSSFFRFGAEDRVEVELEVRLDYQRLFEIEENAPVDALYAPLHPFKIPGPLRCGGYGCN